LLSLPDPISRQFERKGRAAIVVLGMHRSGTSSVAGSLVRLGGAAPANLMPPSETNERGHWESNVIVELNDDILAAAGSEWQDWRPFDVSRIDSQTMAVLRMRARAALAGEYGDASLPIIKDPRMCRLMGFWAPVFDEAGWSVCVILPLRSPLEVAWSLKRRNGISAALGCLMWLRHVLDAEAETRGLPRTCLQWGTFLRDRGGLLTQIAKQLDLDGMERGESTSSELDEFVTPDLRHHEATEAEMRTDAAVTELVRDAYRALIELEDDPGDRAVLDRLDDIRSRFETAVATFDPAMRELEEERRQSQSAYAAERDTAAERDRIARQLAAERESAVRLAAERDELVAEGVRTAAERDAFELELTSARQDYELLFRRLGEANRAIARAEGVIAHIVAQHKEDSRGAVSRSGVRKLRSARRSASLSQQDIESVRGSVFFDAAYYLETNPDVVAAGMDPALHYLAHGGAEGRDPGPHFSTNAYLARHADVAKAGVNALAHYETSGWRERRSVLPHPSNPTIGS
jgi:hypothetical protein